MMGLYSSAACLKDAGVAVLQPLPECFPHLAWPCTVWLLQCMCVPEAQLA